MHFVVSLKLRQG